MQNGAVGNLCGSSIMRGFPQAEERIWGSNGSMVLSGNGIQVFSTRPVDGKRPGEVNAYTKFPDTSWTADWVSALRQGRALPAASRRSALARAGRTWHSSPAPTSPWSAALRSGVPVFAERFEVACV